MFLHSGQSNLRLHGIREREGGSISPLRLAPIWISRFVGFREGQQLCSIATLSNSPMSEVFFLFSLDDVNM